MGDREGRPYDSHKGRNGNVYQCVYALAQGIF